MAEPTTVHWRVPTTIAAAYVAALLFTVGHHLFYASLTGKPVENGVFDQQQNLAIGNAFAFLVRAALVIAVGGSYWQIFWHTLLNKKFPLTTADSLAGILSSLVDIASPKTWLASPLLVSVAAIAWLIPFATIIPAATLTVSLQSHIDHKLMPLKTPDFLGSSMARFISLPNGEGGTGLMYLTPANLLEQVVTGTALDGEIPKLPSPATNASYILQYPAPYVQCAPMPVSMMSSWKNVLGCDPAGDSIRPRTNVTDGYDQACGGWDYLAWVPDEQMGLVPFANGSLRTSDDLVPERGAGFQNLGSYNSSAANLYVAPASVAPTSIFSANTEALTWFPLNCSLYSASYKTKFTFQESSQSVDVLDISIMEPIMPILGNMSDIPSTDLGLFPNSSQPDDVLIAMNCQALMQVLGQLLIGTLINPGAGMTGITYEQVYQTQILLTQLAFTNEMLSLYNASGGSLDSTEVLTSPWYKQSLADAIENLFQNMTLSLFSRNEFLSTMNHTTNVTTTTLRNVYTYNPQRLWLAYGLALIFGLAAIALGYSSLIVAGASYSNKFSTILRVTGGNRINVDIKEADRLGQDPLPKYLGRAKLLDTVQDMAKDVEMAESRSTSRTLAVTETSAMIEHREEH